MADVLPAAERSSVTTDPRVERIARLLHDTFVSFHESFLEVTHRAATRFLQREWDAHQDDNSERLNLHKKAVWSAVESAQVIVPADADEARQLWVDARRRYVSLVSQRMDFELAETFYNSVTRRLFEVIGLDIDLEFLWLGPTALPADDGSRGEYRNFPVDDSLADSILQILEHSPLASQFHAIERDADRVAGVIETWLSENWDGHIDALDILRPVFYRNKGAYLVGRLRWLNRVNPIILPITVSDDGVRVDAVLLTELAASRLFGYTRSYFHVLARRPAAVVSFLKSLLPVKPVAELYTSIGYSAHGKTNLFRALYRHMEHSNTRFERARGARGMVMAVFTLPSFDVVFKLIKDRFPQSKRTTPEDVQRRYKLVFDHDKVGRLVDAQEFRELSFRRDRFDEELIEELLEDCTRTVTVTDDEVILHHVYTERRLYPLDLYLREMGPDLARAAAIDYGNAIKDLASANIFPGDLFPKNFGVSRHGVVVFYDYDELALLSEVNFRTMPVSQSYEDEMLDQPWFPVEPNDVFPEEFRTYLRSPRIVGEVFDEFHPEISTVEFWQAMKDGHEGGRRPDFFPYPHQYRFADD
ncbi:MAG: bifunctional isocitrate dehydrogenase kinase/phosphatase [Acidimicrobiales bacterium]